MEIVPMPETHDRLLRASEILRGCPEKGIPALIPISKSLFWQRVREGKFPKGILLGTKTRVWTYSSIQKLIADLAAQEHSSKVATR